MSDRNNENRERALGIQRCSGKLNRVERGASTQGNQSELMCRRTNLWQADPQGLQGEQWKGRGDGYESRFPPEATEPSKAL